MKSNEILFISLWPQPANVYYTASYLQALDRTCRHPVSAWVSYKFPRDFAYTNVRIKRIYCPFNINKENLFPLATQPFVFLWFALRLFFNQARILQIYFTYPWLTILYPLLRWKFKIIHVLHDIKPHLGEEKLRNRLGIWMAIKFANIVIVHARVLKEALILEYGVPEDRVVVFPLGHSGLTLKYGHPTTAEEPGTILFAGRILHYKGLHCLLEAFRRLIEKMPEARLIIAGPGDIGPYKQALSLLGERVELHNKVVGDDEFADIVRRASIVALPYIEGSHSAALMTALTFGKPVVCTKVGGFPEIIDHGVNGFLVPPGDVERLEEALVTLLQDENLRKSFGKKGRERVFVDMSWDKIASMISEIYDRILSEKK